MSREWRWYALAGFRRCSRIVLLWLESINYQLVLVRHLAAFPKRRTLLCREGHLMPVKSETGNYPSVSVAPREARPSDLPISSFQVQGPKLLVAWDFISPQINVHCRWVFSITWGWCRTVSGRTDSSAQFSPNFNWTSVTLADATTLAS